MVTCVCVVCGKTFERAPNTAVKAKVCTPFDGKHIRKKEVQPDGSVKLKSCGCCRCVYKSTLARQRSMEGKVIPLSKIEEFLATAKKMYGTEIALAFRVGLNVMLRVTELSNLEAADFDPNAKPLPMMTVMALKKKVKMHYPVDIDPAMAKDLLAYIKGRPGRIFPIPVRTLQDKFKKVAKVLGFGHLSIHSLRHTGIANRARYVKNLNQLDYIRRQARHESIETTKMYLGLESEERVEMAKSIKWF